MAASAVSVPRPTTWTCDDPDAHQHNQGPTESQLLEAKHAWARATADEASALVRLQVLGVSCAAAQRLLEGANHQPPVRPDGGGKAFCATYCETARAQVNALETEMHVLSGVFAEAHSEAVRAQSRVRCLVRRFAQESVPPLPLRGFADIFGPCPCTLARVLTPQSHAAGRGQPTPYSEIGCAALDAALATARLHPPSATAAASHARHAEFTHDHDDDDDDDDDDAAAAAPACPALSLKRRRRDEAEGNDAVEVHRARHGVQSDPSLATMQLSPLSSLPPPARTEQELLEEVRLNFLYPQ